jgi:hypothetical protein
MEGYFFDFRLRFQLDASGRPFSVQFGSRQKQWQPKAKNIEE